MTLIKTDFTERRTFGYGESPGLITQGTEGAPVPASTVVCDSGALVAGDYFIELSVAFDNDTPASNKNLVAQLRNAANNADIAELGTCEAGQRFTRTINFVTIATNERVRIVTGSVQGVASSIVYASLRCTKIS